MYATQLCISTLREAPADAEVLSHQLLLRAGYIYKLSSGVYVYGPLLKRVLDKVSQLIAHEISQTGALEVVLPILQEQGLWQKSGRWAHYLATGTLLTTQDRNGHCFGLAPTAEEVVTDYIASRVKSYKQLPVSVFQQHTKFRDEIRPRFGLLRVKEFVMMDAYSFHASQACLEQTYQQMIQAYVRIFAQLELEVVQVEADAGEIGGSGSHEFMATAAIGEDTILLDSAGYAANVETAVARIARPQPLNLSEQLVYTPAASSVEAVVEQLAAQLQVPLEAGHVLKSGFYTARLDAAAQQQVSVATFIQGDRQLNEVKLRNAIAAALGASVLALEPMDSQQLESQFQTVAGFIGPQGLKAQLMLLDAQLDLQRDYIVGANQLDHHLLGFRFSAETLAGCIQADLLLQRAGDLSPNGLPLTEKKGIEIGHVFQLGRKYSAPMGALFQNAAQQLEPFVMGCYGIGTSRLLAALAEQKSDAQGLVWPLKIAPYQVVIVPLPQKSEALGQLAQDTYLRLKQAGVEVIYDDRELSAGVKFKDWDLMGIPLRLVFGKKLAAGCVEFKLRTAQAQELPIAQVIPQTLASLQSALQANSGDSARAD